jgi:hypothetical protein
MVEKSVNFLKISPEMEVYIPSVTQHLCTLNIPHVICGKVGLYRHTPIIFYRGFETEAIHNLCVILKNTQCDP